MATDISTHDYKQGGSEAKTLYESAMGYLKSKEIEYNGKKMLLPGDEKAAAVLLDDIVKKFDPRSDTYAAKAMYVLASLHESNVHPNASVDEAIRLYKIVASTSQGANAKLSLGLMYLEGWKTDHNPEEGMALVNDSLAELEKNGMVDPWYYERLGGIYCDAKDTKARAKNYQAMQKAVFYFEKAVKISLSIEDQARLESARDGLERARKWCDVLKK